MELYESEGTVGERKQYMVQVLEEEWKEVFGVANQRSSFRSRLGAQKP